MTAASTAIVTGSLGLVGAATVRRLTALGLDVVGVDNDQRRRFFGPAASNAAMRLALEMSCKSYRHLDADIRDRPAMDGLIAARGRHLALIVHAAAQPSHDWAASDPVTDFAINAEATLGLLEACRRQAPDALFIFVRTNKVYGDRPNALPLVDIGTRLEIASDHPFHARGIDESLPIDQTRHSLFGVSKTAADLMVQEYALRYGLRSVVFRAGCLTGEDHKGAKSHGFLAYLCASARAGAPYEIIGHGGKQVRDNLHADDLADAFCRVLTARGPSRVYNIGGGRRGSCSVLEALDMAAEILGRPVVRHLTATPRYGDHAWWITDTARFEADHPGWRPRHSARELIERLLAQGLAQTR